jgi:uncharacterized membrane protein
MTYVVTKIIKGNPYLYLVRSERDGDRVRQVFVRYLGRADSEEAQSRAASWATEEVAPVSRGERVVPAHTPEVFEQPIKSEEIIAGQLSKQHGLDIKINEGAEGGEYSGGTVFVGKDTTPIQAFAANWVDKNAPDFKTSKTYPKNVTSEVHEIAHGLFSKNPEVGHQAILELKALGVPDEVDAFESLVDTAGLYLLEPDAITNPKVKDVISKWLAKAEKTEMPTPTAEPTAVTPLESKPEVKGEIIPIPVAPTPEVAIPPVEPKEEVKPEPQKEQITKGDIIDKTGQDIAKQLDINYNGIQQGYGDIPTQYTFTDKQTGSTFLAGSIDEAKSKLDNMRVKFISAEGIKPTSGQIIQPVIKEPWQMTKAERTTYIKQKGKESIQRWNESGGKGFPPSNPGRWDVSRVNKAADELGMPWGEGRVAIPQHKYEVMVALKQGKPVPSEVLKDYPDLGNPGKGIPLTPQEETEAVQRMQKQIPQLKQEGVFTQEQREGITARGYDLEKVEYREGLGILDQPLPTKAVEPPMSSKEKRKPELSDDFNLVKYIWESKNYSTKELANQYNIPVNKMYKILSNLEDKGILYGWHFSGESRGKTGENLKSLEWTVNTDKQSDAGGTLEELRVFYNDKKTK